MKKFTILLGLILLAAVFAAAASSDAPVIPASLRNNRYYLESVRLTRLAQQSYETGDYDASTQYADEALRYAQLSDEWVALQLKIKETNDAIAAAKSRLDFADSFNAAAIYPTEYENAAGAYGEAVNFRSTEEWDNAIAAARRVLDFLAYIEAPPSLPARYAVRSWAGERDCLWNIAARPWVYGDPRQWRTLYEANRSKLPESTNPDLIEPGLILDIPSIKGEYREGLWDPAKTYDPLK